MAWSGVLLKLFDVGAKWAAIAVLLNGFAGTPLTTGILLAGGVSLVYITVGGLWADIWTDFAQFIVQIVAGGAMFVIVLEKFGGFSAVFTIWDQLPESNGRLFNTPYTPGFALAFLFINFLSYNGGTWNLATRYISSSSGSEARKAALLSGILYAVWPLILFFPMWAAPLLLPDLEDPTRSYALLTQKLLPPGMVGLVLASMFANTMSMTSSDSNTISSVITRDILPNLSKKFRNLKQKQSLQLARWSTFGFTVLTLIVAINADSFGGVLGLLISWFAAIVGPISVPMILGLLPAFRYCDAKTAIISITGGLAAFIISKYLTDSTQLIEIASPLVISFVLYTFFGWLNRQKEIPDEVNQLLDNLKTDTEENR